MHVNVYDHNNPTVMGFFFLFAVAMKAMNKVASHINEMQKIHEEFGAVFDQLITEQSSEKKEVGWTDKKCSSLTQSIKNFHIK